MADPVRTIAPHLHSLKAPAVLRSQPWWLCWRLEQIQGEKKPRKIPYYANGSRRFGVQGSEKDRAQLVTFEDAKKAAIRQGCSGVGMALLPGSNVVALDFDDCVHEGAVNPVVESLVQDTYAEFSPSGRGVRAFMIGDLGNRKSHSSPDQFGFETFSSNGFVTFTGDILPAHELAGSENRIAMVDAKLVSFFEQRFPGSTQESGEGYDGIDEPIVGLTEEQIRKVLDVLDPAGGHDDWLQVGMALHHETGGDGFEFWDTWSAQSDKYPGREALESRWLSFGQSGLRPVTARSLVRRANELGADIPIGIADPSEFDVIAADATPSSSYFRVRQLSAFMETMRSTTWLIKGFMPHASLGVLFGASGSGKSFLAFDVCMSLARGADWNGLRTVRKCKVLYVVAEGASGFVLRAKAYCEYHGIDPAELDIHIISDITPNLLDSSHVSRLVDEVKATKYDLIVLDTFAQVTPGANENSGEDMGLALGAIGRIGRAAGAMVLVIAHSGKDASKGIRGWSGIKAAADLELEVTRFEHDRCVEVTKLKDGQGEGQQYGFTLQSVVLGQDEDGDNITSCVLSYGEAKRKSSRQVLSPKGKNEKLVLRVIHDLAGLSASGELGQVDLIEAAVAQIPHDGGKRDNRRRDVLRAIESLGASGYVVVADGVVRIPVTENA